MKNFSKFILASALVLAFGSQASASMSITSGLGQTAVPAANNYIGDLSALGYNQLFNGGADVTVNATGSIKFYYHGAESGFQETFVAPPLSFDETDGTGVDTWNGPGVLIGAINVTAGQLFSTLGIGFTSSGPGGGQAGTPSFGVFIHDSQLTAGVFNGNTSTTVYFGFDDDPIVDDDNHDDMIVSAVWSPDVIQEVPEPASMAVWGLGALGMMVARRRRNSARVA